MYLPSFTCLIVSLTCSPWNHALLPWWSPPSDWIGSTINPTQGFPTFFCFSSVSSTFARQRLSSASFSRAFSSRGYLKDNSLEVDSSHQFYLPWDSPTCIWGSQSRASQRGACPACGWAWSASPKGRQQSYHENLRGRIRWTVWAFPVPKRRKKSNIE